MASKNLSVMITDLQGYSSKSAAFSRSDLLHLVQTHNNLLKPVKLVADDKKVLGYVQMAFQKKGFRLPPPRP